MAKYCPKCAGEFEGDFSECPSDSTKLVDQKPEGGTVRYIDIYSARGEIEAERIVNFLRAEGVDARENINEISQLPSSVETRYLISVVQGQEKNAKLRIEQAREDGIISKLGSFI